MLSNKISQESLIERSGNYFMRLPSFSSPLMLAIVLQQRRTFTVILQQEFNTAGVKNLDGFQALDYIIMTGQNDLVDLSISIDEKFILREFQNNEHYIKLATQAANWEILKYFLFLCRQNSVFNEAFCLQFAMSRPDKLVEQLLKNCIVNYNVCKSNPIDHPLHAVLMTLLEEHISNLRQTQKVIGNIVNYMEQDNAVEIQCKRVQKRKKELNKLSLR